MSAWKVASLGLSTLGNGRTAWVRGKLFRDQATSGYHQHFVLDHSPVRGAVHLHLILVRKLLGALKMVLQFNEIT